MVVIVISDTVCVPIDIRDMLSEGGWIRYCEGATYCALRSGQAEMHYCHTEPISLASVLAMIEFRERQFGAPTIQRMRA